jgi:hypothetical protein
VREGPSVTGSQASKDLLWICQGVSNTLPVLWKKVGMGLDDVPLPLVGQFDFCPQVRTGDRVIQAPGEMLGAGAPRGARRWRPVGLAAPCTGSLLPPFVHVTPLQSASALKEGVSGAVRPEFDCA